MDYSGKSTLKNYVRDVEEIKRNWGWFFAMGLLLIILGAGVASFSFYSTIFSVVLLGVFLIGAGVVQIVQGFLARQWSGLFLSLLIGCLYLITGFLCVTRPGVAAMSLTLWIAAFCLIAGLFRMMASLIIRFDQWGWVFFNGFITFILGMMIYSDWPLSGLWLIGLFIGIDLILSGWSWIMLSLKAHYSK